MSARPLPATARLAVRLPDELVYCIPRGILPDTARCSASIASHLERRSSRLATVKDLVTDEVFLLPRASLSRFPVPDEQVGNLIRWFGVRGLRRPYKVQPSSKDSSEVPLYGNVTNPKWASINLGGACNNHCVFCYTDWLRAVPDIRTDQAKDIIDRFAEISTIELLSFSGGEPTIRQDLISLFEYANSTGFPDIGLQTNGRELRELHLAESLVEFGLKRVLLSIHGPNDEIHDSITRSPCSFVETLEGLRNLIALSVDLTINIVMCQKNYGCLGETVALLSEILDGSGRLRFSYPIVEGSAFENVDQVIVAFSRLKPLVVEALQLAEVMGLKVEVANMPLCIPGTGDCDTTYDTITLSSFVEASPFYKFNVSRGEKSVKLRRCARCSKVTLCRGIQVEYLRVYPHSMSEFKPIG